MDSFFGDDCDPLENTYYNQNLRVPRQNEEHACWSLLSVGSTQPNPKHCYWQQAKPRESVRNSNQLDRDIVFLDQPMFRLGDTVVLIGIRTLSSTPHD